MRTYKIDVSPSRGVDVPSIGHANGFGRAISPEATAAGSRLTNPRRIAASLTHRVDMPMPSRCRGAATAIERQSEPRARSSLVKSPA
jgi:hypothetical protein